MNCHYCHEEIPSKRLAYQRVHGWEQHRSGGGTNHVTLREPGDEWACAHCIDKLKQGVAIEQQKLL